MRNLHWFRADLRIADNSALLEAISLAEEMLAVFIITPKTWQTHDDAPVKIQFILNNLQALSEQLYQLGIPLLIRTTDYFSECLQVLAKLCQDYKIDGLYFNKQYEYNEQRRDKLIIKSLEKQGILVKSFDDQLIVPPGAILNNQQGAMKVFTPFKKRWLEHVEKFQSWIPQKKSAKKFTTSIRPEAIPKQIAGFINHIDLNPWPAGEVKAQQMLNGFCAGEVERYHQQRDFPSLNGTSRLSAYLAQGVISPRQCVQGLIKQLKLHSFIEIQGRQGAATWLSELIWREFYKHTMFHFPEVCRHKPFRPATDELPWRYDEKQFAAWCAGKTGFPLVDAAMRQLNQTGWMHNRLRMVTAMFLSKVLFLDWRLGEKYFMQNLIDGDLAANNGGWQWCASTGTDAVPYFRIFNPVTQSQRFDPEGYFIRKYFPELASLDNRVIHNPYQFGVKQVAINYPEPIIDYKAMRNKVMEAFKNL